MVQLRYPPICLDLSLGIHRRILGVFHLLRELQQHWLELDEAFGDFVGLQSADFRHCLE